MARRLAKIAMPRPGMTCSCDIWPKMALKEATEGQTTVAVMEGVPWPQLFWPYCPSPLGVQLGHTPQEIALPGLQVAMFESLLANNGPEGGPKWPNTLRALPVRGPEGQFRWGVWPNWPPRGSKTAKTVEAMEHLP